MLEVLIALIIFMLLVLAISALFMNSIFSIYQAGFQSEAVHEAQKDLEHQLEGQVSGDSKEIVLFEGESLEGKVEGTVVEVDRVYDPERGATVRYVTFVPEE